MLAELDVAPVARSDAGEMTINELCAAYLDFAGRYYVKDGRPTNQLDAVRRAIRVVKGLFGETRAADSCPPALRTVQEDMVKKPALHPPSKRTVPYCRTTINAAHTAASLPCDWWPKPPGRA